jgi:hypothetical protein
MPYLQERVYRNGLSRISPFVFPIRVFQKPSLKGAPSAEREPLE